MDALVIFGLSVYLAMRAKKERPDIIQLEVRKNLTWFKDEKAFMILFNKIMGDESK